MLPRPICFFKVLYASCLLLISLSPISCKKGDLFAKDQTLQQGSSTTFFNAHKPENAITRQLSDYFLRLDAETGIAAKMTSRFGILTGTKHYYIWAKKKELTEEEPQEMMFWWLIYPFYKIAIQP